MTDRKKIPAWQNTATGTIIPANRQNKILGKKAGMVAIVAEFDEELGEYINPNSHETIAAVSDSGSLSRIIRALDTNRNQRLQLLQAGLEIKGAKSRLVDAGFFNPKTDEQAVNDFVPDEVGTQVANMQEEANKSDDELDQMKKASGSNVKTTSASDELDI